MTDRDPDDISHLDFDVDVDDEPLTLDDGDRLLRDRLAWQRYRQIRRARWAGAILAIALLAVSISAFLNHVSADSDDVPNVDPERIDNAPTSAELASYLPDANAIEAVAPVLALTPGNTGGAYDNLSFEELDAGGPTSASYAADAGVRQVWTASNGREMVVSIYLFEDRTMAETAETVALQDLLGTGGQEREVQDFRSVDSTGSTPYRIAARVLSRFLVTFELAGFDAPTADELLAVVSDASAAVH